MANFMNQATTSGFDAESYARGAASSRQATRDSSGLRQGSNGFFGIGAKQGNVAESSYSVVGINTTMIPQMRTEIRNYVQAIQDHLNNVKVQTDPTVALKGTGMEQAVKEYIAKVVAYCNALCSNLLAFSDKLAKVQAAWEASDMNMSSTVNSGSSDLDSASTVYEEQNVG